MIEMSQIIRRERNINEPRPLADALADVIENALHAMLAAQADDGARKSIVMKLRERGALSDELTAMAFYWYPGLKHA